MKLCPGCLKQRDNDLVYCNACLKNVFNNKRQIIPFLDFDKNKYIAIKHELSDHFSISGVQDKISLKIESDKLIPTETGGRYILKPIPTADIPNFKTDVPANEHLTMQIAKQVFKIKTAENALIHFKDGELAYIVKRFDVTKNGKIAIEDFCQLKQISEESHGKNYKYDFSYESAASVIDQFCAASKIEIEKYFFHILFCYFFSNGDAHLKNFSLLQTIQKDYILSPAYDLLSTSLHFPNESRMALDLFDEFESESFRQNGFYKRDDFLEFGKILQIKNSRVLAYIEKFYESSLHSKQLIKNSFLSEKAKKQYIHLFEDRLLAMKD